MKQLLLLVALAVSGCSANPIQPTVTAASSMARVPPVRSLDRVVAVSDIPLPPAAPTPEPPAPPPPVPPDEPFVPFCKDVNLPRAVFDGWVDMDGTPVMATVTLANEGIWEVSIWGDAVLVQQKTFEVSCGQTITRSVWADTWTRNPLEWWHIEVRRNGVLVLTSPSKQNTYDPVRSRGLHTR
ncbi:MAG: hypothetical protein ND807_01670 [Vicinamibacterales bacterium]|nr:hypothetical protein [Vicinamibacterales bacterium]